MTSRLTTFLRTDAMRWTLMYYVLFICLGLSIGLVGPTLPSLAEQTQTRVGQLGTLFLASAFGGLLGTLLGGRLFDRVRGHPALGIAQLISAALIALYPVIPSAWILLVVVIGKGVKVGSNVTLLHGVTLGGSAKGWFDGVFADGFPEQAGGAIVEPADIGCQQQAVDAVKSHASGEDRGQGKAGSSRHCVLPGAGLWRPRG